MFLHDPFAHHRNHAYGLQVLLKKRKKQQTKNNLVSEPFPTPLPSSGIPYHKQLGKQTRLTAFRRSLKTYQFCEWLHRVFLYLFFFFFLSSFCTWNDVTHVEYNAHLVWGLIYCEKGEIMGSPDIISRKRPRPSINDAWFDSTISYDVFIPFVTQSDTKDVARPDLDLYLDSLQGHFRNGTRKTQYKIKFVPKGVNRTVCYCIVGQKHLYGNVRRRQQKWKVNILLVSDVFFFSFLLTSFLLILLLNHNSWIYISIIW